MYPHGGILYVIFDAYHTSLSILEGWPFFFLAEAATSPAVCEFPWPTSMQVPCKNAEKIGLEAWTQPKDETNHPHFLHND